MTYQQKAKQKAREKHVSHSPEIGDYIDNFEAGDLDTLTAQTITDLLDELEKEMGEECKEYTKCEDCGRDVKRGTEVPLDGEGNCVAGGTHHHLECLPNTLHRKLTKKFNQIRM